MESEIPRIMDAGARFSRGAWMTNPPTPPRSRYSPSAIPPAPRSLAQAEFGDEVLRGARGEADRFGDHADIGDRMREDAVDEGGQVRGRPASCELALELSARELSGRALSNLRQKKRVDILDKYGDAARDLLAWAASPSRDASSTTVQAAVR
jgi:hypothetical protein